MKAIWMRFRREFEVFGFERLLVKPRPARLLEQGEEVSFWQRGGLFVLHSGIVQALKLSPQEQELAAFGLFTLNPPSCNESI
jgi:hypothetical protein